MARPLGGKFGLFVACLGVFDVICSRADGVRLGTTGNTSSPGGVLGEVLNHWTTWCLNRTGATLFYTRDLYAVSLVFLTDFHVLSWLRKLRFRAVPWQRPGDGTGLRQRGPPRRWPRGSSSAAKRARGQSRTREIEFKPLPPSPHCEGRPRRRCGNESSTAKDAREAEEDRGRGGSRIPAPAWGRTCSRCRSRVSRTTASRVRVRNPRRPVVGEGETIKAAAGDRCGRDADPTPSSVAPRRFDRRKGPRKPPPPLKRRRPWPSNCLRRR
jgi:hypothetical protein